jgi:hypothetical protein
MKRSFVLTLSVVLFTVGIATTLLINGQRRIVKERMPMTSEYLVSGPFTHRNLSIFLVHGPNQVAGADFLTLQEALDTKKVVVYETKDVNELAIQNLSTQDVYVQAGDIVKGGQQDRMIGVDLIVPPRSGRVPIAAFCVEHGRWSGRGEEKASVFSSSADSVATKEIKLAAKRSNSQGAVWENVKVAQDKLSSNVGTRVNSPVSESSLQLAVENRKVQETAESYINALSGVVQGKNDVIGYIFAINGELNSADVYASNALFKKLWPKLLKANAVEAIAKFDRDRKVEAPSTDIVERFLRQSETGTLNEKEVTARVKLATRENDESIFFETRDRNRNDAWVHRNYIKK